MFWIVKNNYKKIFCKIIKNIIIFCIWFVRLFKKIIFINNLIILNLGYLKDFFEFDGPWINKKVLFYIFEDYGSILYFHCFSNCFLMLNFWYKINFKDN